MDTLIVKFVMSLQFFFFYGAKGTKIFSRTAFIVLAYIYTANDKLEFETVAQNGGCYMLV